MGSSDKCEQATLTPSTPLLSPSKMQSSQAPKQAQPPNNPNTSININTISRPGTPPRPPYSPVTPVFAQLAPVRDGHPIVPPPVFSPSVSQRPPQRDQDPPPAPPPQKAQIAASAEQSTSASTSTAPAPPPVATEHPPPVPISESDNPDAIALRSAISILQLQKQQSLRDIQTLDKMKRAAAADPERFARELAAGDLSARDGGFMDLSGDMDDDDNNDGEEEGQQGDGGNGNGESDGSDPFYNLGKIPTPQNIVRMPPINWAKYQIVGEPLDKMHAEQLRRPAGGEPRQELGQRSPEHVLASPYRPLVDKLETPGSVKGGNRKKS